MERKATDILLDLEEKVDKLLSYVTNMDNNYKIIISRLDKIKSNPVSVASTSASPKPAIDETQKPKQLEKPENPIDFISVDAPEVKLTPANKVRVSQVIKYPKDKGVKQTNVVLASVKVYDSNGKDGGAIVAENRTDQNGRWKIDLSPGQYFVHVLKPASTQKPQIDHYFSITVDGQKSSIELDSLG